RAIVVCAISARLKATCRACTLRELLSRDATRTRSSSKTAASTARSSLKISRWRLHRNPSSHILSSHEQRASALSGQGFGLLQHGRGVFQHGLRNLAARKHPCQLLGTIFRTIQMSHRGNGTPAALKLFDVEVVVGKTSDLGKVGHAEHLCLAREALEALPDLFCHPAANPGIHFVE